MVGHWENLLALAQQNYFRFLGLKVVFSKTFILGAIIYLMNHMLSAWRCPGWVQLASPKLSDVLTQDTWELQHGCFPPKRHGHRNSPWASLWSYGTCRRWPRNISPCNVYVCVHSIFYTFTTSNELVTIKHLLPGDIQGKVPMSLWSQHFHQSIYKLFYGAFCQKF